MPCSEHHQKHQQSDPGGSMGWRGHHTLNSCLQMISGTTKPFTEASWRPSSLLTKVTRSFYIYLWFPSWISTICFHVMFHPSDSATKEATRPFVCVIDPTTLGGSWLEAPTKPGLPAESTAIIPVWVLLEFVHWDGQAEVPLMTAWRGNNGLVHAFGLQRSWGRNMVWSILVPSISLGTLAIDPGHHGGTDGL